MNLETVVVMAVVAEIEKNTVNLGDFELGVVFVAFEEAALKIDDSFKLANRSQGKQLATQ